MIAYVLCIVLACSGFTIAFLGKDRGCKKFNKALAIFAAGMLLMCFYDMAIYYLDYGIGGFSSLKILRIGNCIIAGSMCLWIGVQENIIKREALQMINKMVKAYLLFYMATDIGLIISFLAASVAHIIFAATANDKQSFLYMITVTTMLIWNYVAYFWGEASVYWGNSEFIRTPLDLTIVFWLILNAATMIYAYNKVFLGTFSEQSEDTNRQSNREIADTLFLSESTVKTHIYNIFRKMDVKNRVGVICVINGDVEDGQTQQ